jgi:hypothetical protein
MIGGSCLEEEGTVGCYDGPTRDHEIEIRNSIYYHDDDDVYNIIRDSTGFAAALTCEFY